MLLEFLENKPLFYTEFDPTRMQKAYESVKKHLKLPIIIHMIGTNGKGTTGRYLAQMLQTVSSYVGHYTSPHIHDFNERIWLNGSSANYVLLETAFEELNSILEGKWQESLSYFEYTTLLCIVVCKNCEYLVLEAGLGGEYDATAVFKNSVTVITPIGIDHESFLGATLKEIVTTKLNAIQEKVVIAKQSKSAEVLIRDFVQNKALETRWVPQPCTEIAKLSLPKYLQENVQTAFEAFSLFSKQAINFQVLETLGGRFFALNDKIRVDVGHNPLAALALKHSLGKSKVILVYNTFSDKAYEEILKILKKNIEHVEIIDVVDDRIVKKEDLVSCLLKLDISSKDFMSIDPVKDYLVFGSFSVVETFLMRYNG